MHEISPPAQIKHPRACCQAVVAVLLGATVAGCTAANMRVNSLLLFAFEAAQMVVRAGAATELLHSCGDTESMQ